MHYNNNNDILKSWFNFANMEDEEMEYSNFEEDWCSTAYHTVIYQYREVRHKKIDRKLCFLRKVQRSFAHISILRKILQSFAIPDLFFFASRNNKNQITINYDVYAMIGHKKAAHSLFNIFSSFFSYIRKRNSLRGSSSDLDVTSRTATR